MNTIDYYEDVDKLVEHPVFSRLSSRFENLFCHSKSVKELYPNSVYINNPIENAISISSYPKQIFINIESTPISGAQTDFASGWSLPIKFSREHDRKLLGGYLPDENVLVLCDITHDFGDFTIEVIEKIMDWIDTNAINYSILNHVFQDEINTIYLHTGDNVYQLKKVGSAEDYRANFIREVQSKAQDIIKQMRENWQKALIREQERYKKLRKSVRAMPGISRDTCFKHQLSLYIDRTYIIYAFRVKFDVMYASDEAARKRVKLEEPITYEGILHIYIDETDKVAHVKLSKYDGISNTGHLHSSLASNEVCTGTYRATGRKAKTIDEIIQIKNDVVANLNDINIYSCYGDSNNALKEKFRVLLLNVPVGKMDDVWVAGQCFTPTSSDIEPVDNDEEIDGEDLE